MNEPFRIRHARPIVITTTLAVLSVFTIIAVVRYTRSIKSKHTYKIWADQALLRGLKKAMDVRILGESVGVVTEIRYRDDHPSHVEVQFTVDEPAKHRIRANARVVVTRTLTIGSAFLEIERSTDMLGLIVTNLTSDDYKRLQTNGVRVVEIADGSPASLFRQSLDGAVITAIDGIQVNDVSDYYQRMEALPEGQMVDITIAGVEAPVSVNAAMVMTHRFLQNGMVVYQFQPEKSSVETITEKLGRVQESVATVEESMVESLDSTNTALLDEIVPTFQSMTKTSDRIREETTPKANETLDQAQDTLKHFDESADAITSGAERVTEKVVEVCDENAIPAINKFGNAAESLETTSQELRKTVDNVGAETSEAIEKLTTAIITLQDVLDRSREVVEVLQSEARDLPGTAKRINGTMQNLNQTVTKAQTTIDGINNHWLLRRSVKKSQEQKSGTKKAGILNNLFHH